MSGDVNMGNVITVAREGILRKLVGKLLKVGIEAKMEARITEGATTVTIIQAGQVTDKNVLKVVLTVGARSISEDTTLRRIRHEDKSSVAELGEHTRNPSMDISTSNITQRYASVLPNTVANFWFRISRVRECT